MKPFMKMIAAVAADGGIGKGGELLFAIPEDLKRFRQLTSGNTVVMGKNTLISLPGSRGLKNRRNIVLTHSGTDADNVEAASSAEELMKMLNADETVFVIGGASLYESLMPLCDTLYITHIDKTFDADRFFPAISEKEWEVSEESENFVHQGVTYRYVTYIRKYE